MPIGIQSFPSMVEGNYVYVDKTHFIPKLEILGRAYFLTRPRRFGKSLFISTLESYFEGKKELFKGLAIEKYKEENGQDWQTYPVLKLDLNAKKYTKEEHLDEILHDHIRSWELKYDVKTNCSSADSAFADVIQSLYRKYNKKVVVLIDEYDKPLIATLENEELHEAYRSTLKAFYSVIKSSNDYLHLSFLTGVTKFSKVSIFSDLNNLDDISFDEEYSSICGITEEELRNNFLQEIEVLSVDEGNTTEEMLGRLRQKYDGYCFSKKEERIYNPFSVLNALSKKELGNYWFETGTPTFLVRLFENNYFNIPDLETGVTMSKRELDIYKMSYDNLIPLLFQAGYLTIKGHKKDPVSFTEWYVLSYPNWEVKYAFLFCLMEVYTSARRSTDGMFKIDFYKEAMEAGDIDRVLTLIKALLASIPYDCLPPDKLFLREHNYQTAIYLIFALMGEYVRTEVHSSQGRSDVEVETQDSIYIFEFKVGGKPIDAIAQIKEAGYAKKHEASSKNIVLIGATISRNKRTLSKWQVERVL